MSHRPVGAAWSMGFALPELDDDVVSTPSKDPGGFLGRCVEV